MVSTFDLFVFEILFHQKFKRIRQSKYYVWHGTIVVSTGFIQVKTKIDFKVLKSNCNSIINGH